jgi:thiol-disulfide isomerase/thioredoxin
LAGEGWLTTINKCQWKITDDVLMCVYLKFYAPWCGHCKKLEPIYAHVAQALHDTPIRVGRVDCTRFPSVGTEFKVNGFPTIIL